MRELHRSVSGLLASRSLCFLVPSPPLAYPADEDEALRLWRSGAGVALQHLELRNAQIRDLARKLAFREGCAVSASLYVSRLGSSSMSEHVDAWDAWLAQVRGAKNLTFSEGEHPSRIRLAVGDWLWLPSGVAHVADTTEADSVHISINFHRRRRLILSD